MEERGCSVVALLFSRVVVVVVARVFRAHLSTMERWEDSSELFNDAVSFQRVDSGVEESKERFRLRDA
jgi:hypothetical protein